MVKFQHGLIGTISVVVLQASGGAPSGRPCTAVASNKMALMQHAKLKAYSEKHYSCSCSHTQLL